MSAEEEIQERGFEEEYVPNFDLTNTFSLRLGDVINITSTLEILNGIFFIKYLSPNKIVLFNDKDNSFKIVNKNIMNYGDDKLINITKIDLLYRNPYPGYAKQNNLIINTWLLIEFGINEINPQIIPITCKITGVSEDNDVIVLLTYPDNRIFYINFNYYGIPEELNINKISIIPAIKSKRVVADEGIEGEEKEQHDNDDNDEEKDPINALDQAITEADKVNKTTDYFFYGEGNPLYRRYPIEIQTDDLLNIMSAALKSSSPYEDVVTTDEIHIMIDRFVQLRKQFSIFNKDLTVLSALTNEPPAPKSKPLKQYYDKFNIALHWIIPIVTNVKEISDDILKEEEDVPDPDNTYILLTEMQLYSDLDKNKKIENLNNNDNTNPYKNYLTKISEIITPFKKREFIKKSTKLILTKDANTNITTIVDSFDDDKFRSYALFEDELRDTGFSLLKYNVGLPYLEANVKQIGKQKDKEQSKSKFFQRKLLEIAPDKMQITSFLVLPEFVVRFSRVSLPVSSILLKSNLSLNYLTYFELLNDNTKVVNVDVDINTIITKTIFKKKIRNYKLIKQINDDDDDDEENYNYCIDKIVPSTSQLFDTMKEYITGKLSIVDVVSYLEPFLVYTKDIHYILYRNIIKFIEERTKTYKQNYANRKTLFAALVTNKENLKKMCETKKLSLMVVFKLFIDNNVKENVLKAYNLKYDGIDKDFSNSDIYRKIILDDYAKLYCSAISLENKILMVADIKEVNINDENNSLDEIVSISGDKMEEKINSDYNYCLNIMPVITEINSFNYLKYNNKRFEMRINKIEDDEIQEPLLIIKVRDLIIQKENGVLKNFLIRQLARNFSREPNEDENKHWLYCSNTSNTTTYNQKKEEEEEEDIINQPSSPKLLPKFIVEMANEFSIKSPQEYEVFLKELLKRLKAKKSANNIYWVDPSTGYPITRIGFVVEKDLIFNESDEGDEGEQEKEKENEKDNYLLSKEEILLFHNKERNYLINLIMNGLAVKLKIDLPRNHINFILNHVNKYINSLDKKETHDVKEAEKAQKNRNYDPVKFDYYQGSNTILSTVVLFFITYQTSLPKIKSGSFLGCKKIFTGYPLVNDDNEVEGITYFSCVLTKMRTEAEPWKYISKKEVNNTKNMKNMIKNYFIKQQDIKSKIEEKNLQIANGESATQKTTREEDLTRNWEHFLPPLEQQEKNVWTDKSPQPTTESVEHIKTGLYTLSTESLLMTMQSTIFRLSLSIQKQIHEVVSKENNELLMTNYINGENYMSNNCCQTDLNTNSTVYMWLNDQTRGLIEHDNRVALDLTNVITSVNEFVKSSTMCSLFNTKDQYPPILQIFSNSTAYVAFIRYFNYLSENEVENPEMRKLRDTFPPQEKNGTKLSVKEMVEKLKKDKSFDNPVENLEKLLQIVSKINTVLVPFITNDNCIKNVIKIIENPKPSTEVLLVEEGEEFEESNDFNKLMLAYAKSNNGQEEEAKLIQYIYEEIDKNKPKIINFLKIKDNDIAFFRSTRIKNVTMPLESLKSQSNSLYIKINFYKTLISNMVFLYPEQIINYRVNTEITLPPSLNKLHQAHKEKLKIILLRERSPLLQTSNNKTMAILKKVQNSNICLDIVRLSQNLPFFNDTLINCLYESFTLKIFSVYVDVCREINTVIDDETYETTNNDIQSLLNIYLGLSNNFSKNPNEKGIKLSYEQIAEKFYNDALNEKNKLRKTFEDLAPEAREAYNALRVTKGKQKRQNYDAEIWQRDEDAAAIDYDEYQEANNDDIEAAYDNEDSDGAAAESGDEEEDNDKEGDGNNDNDDY